MLTYSRVWVRQLLGGSVVGLQSEGLLPVESEDLGKGSRVVLGEHLTVTARENSLCSVWQHSWKGNKILLDTLRGKASLRSDKTVLMFQVK